MGQLTVATFETAAAVPDDARGALRALLLACADTKLLLGYHYGEWTFGTPTLEAAVANCSLAQSELGHVRLLHGILKSGWGDDPDALVEARASDSYASISYLDEPLPDWPAVVAMTLVADLAVTRVVHAMRASSFLPVRACAAKLIAEERYHAHHGQGWFRTLAADAGARGGLATRVDTALASVTEWFGPAGAPADAALVAAGIKDTSDADLAAAVLADVREAAAPFGMTLADPPRPGAKWDATRRRSAAGHPSDEVLYHLRGTKNEIFKQA